MRECPSCHRCFADVVGACPDDGQPTVQPFAGDPLIDRYCLERRLGHGGMGIVYEARHVYLRTRHALKVIRPDSHADEEKLAKLVRRFRQEALAVAAVKHPNVVNITDCGVTSGAMPFLVMEFIKGVSLEKMLEGGRALTPERAINILRPVASGVGAAHRRGIVHRDLKPANIMIADGAPMDVAVKVLDFGLAKVLARDVLGSLTLEQSGGIIGTPLYLAPEQCRGQETDARTDVYALGLIAYRMIAGRTPFNAATPMGVIELHREADPPPMSSNSVGVPARVEAAVRRALSKDPAARPHSVQAFVDELAAAVAHEQAIQLADTLSLDVKAPAPAAPTVTTTPPPISSPIPPPKNPPASGVSISAAPTLRMPAKTKVAAQQPPLTPTLGQRCLTAFWLFWGERPSPPYQVKVRRVARHLFWGLMKLVCWLSILPLVLVIFASREEIEKNINSLKELIALLLMIPFLFIFIYVIMGIHDVVAYLRDPSAEPERINSFEIDDLLWDSPEKRRWRAITGVVLLIEIIFAVEKYYWGP